MQRIEIGRRRGRRSKVKVCCECFCLNFLADGSIGGTFYGDFPAPPKAHSELKSGNQSYTFK